MTVFSFILIHGTSSTIIDNKYYFLFIQIFRLLSKNILYSLTWWVP